MYPRYISSDGEESRAGFEEWFEHVYGRKWMDIKNEEQDRESSAAYMGWRMAITWVQSQSMKDKP